MILSLAAALACIAVPAQSYAGPVLHFGFNAVGADAASVSKSIGIYTVKVTPGTSPNSLTQNLPILPGPNTVSVTSAVTQQADGLGTRSIVNGSNFDISAQTDSNPTTYINNIFSGAYSPAASQQESLKFDVSNKANNQVYVLNSIDFAGVGSIFGVFNDDVEIMVDGKSVYLGDIPGGNALQNLLDMATGTIDLSFLPESDRTGTSFVVRATDGNDGFFVSAINVTATPEPGSIALFGMALGGAFVAWRRRKTAIR